MKKFISKLAEYAFLLFLAAFLVRSSACFLYSVLPELAATGGIALLVFIICRIIKHKRDYGEW